MLVGILLKEPLYVAEIGLGAVIPDTGRIKNYPHARPEAVVIIMIMIVTIDVTASVLKVTGIGS